MGLSDELAAVSFPPFVGLDSAPLFKCRGAGKLDPSVEAEQGSTQRKFLYL